MVSTETIITTAVVLQFTILKLMIQLLLERSLQLIDWSSTQSHNLAFEAL